VGEGRSWAPDFGISKTGAPPPSASGGLGEIKEWAKAQHPRVPSVGVAEGLAAHVPMEKKKT